jgi:hypothetical protein
MPNKELNFTANFKKDVVIGWSSEIRIEDYQAECDMEIGDVVFFQAGEPGMYNGGMVTVYNLTDHVFRIRLSKETSGGGSSGYTGHLDAYSSKNFSLVGNQMLSSVEPYSDEWGSGWAITFVYP